MCAFIALEVLRVATAAAVAHEGDSPSVPAASTAGSCTPRCTCGSVPVPDAASCALLATATPVTKCTPSRWSLSGRRQRTREGTTCRSSLELTRQWKPCRCRVDSAQCRVRCGDARGAHHPLLDGDDAAWRLSRKLTCVAHQLRAPSTLRSAPGRCTCVRQVGVREGKGEQ